MEEANPDSSFMGILVGIPVFKSNDFDYRRKDAALEAVYHDRRGAVLATSRRGAGGKEILQWHLYVWQGAEVIVTPRQRIIVMDGIPLHVE